MPVVASTGVMNGVLLASAIVPPAIVIVLAWLFLRAGKRHDEREAERLSHNDVRRSGRDRRV